MIVYFVIFTPLFVVTDCAQVGQTSDPRISARFFFTLLHPTRIDVVKKKKRTLIFVGEEFVARKTIPRQREGEEGKGFVTVCTCSLFRKDDRIFPFCYLSA